MYELLIYWTVCSLPIGVIVGHLIALGQDLIPCKQEIPIENDRL